MAINLEWYEQAISNCPLSLAFFLIQCPANELVWVCLHCTVQNSVRFSHFFGIAITNLDKLMPSNEDTRHKCEREKKKKKKRLTNMKGLHLPSFPLSLSLLSVSISDYIWMSSAHYLTSFADSGADADDAGALSLSFSGHMHRSAFSFSLFVALSLAWLSLPNYGERGQLLRLGN